MLYELRSVQPFAQIHDKPHRFDSMTGSHLTTFEAIHQITVHIDILNNDAPQVRTIKDIHHFMDTGFHRLFQIAGIQEMFDLQSQITEDHREGEVLQITSTRMKLVPLAFRIINLRKDDFKGLLCYVRIFLTTSC